MYILYTFTAVSGLICILAFFISSSISAVLMSLYLSWHWFYISCYGFQYVVSL